jgi:Fur family ferric uptake transcriptional regulator
MEDATLIQERWAAYVRREGLKSTRQRRALFECFCEVDGHVSLDEMLERVQRVMPSVGYATVYRTMKLFVEAGIAEEQQFGDGQARFEPVMDEHDHHDHVICRTCGQIFEFEDKEIERRQSVVAQSFGLRLVEHRLDIWGDCEQPDDCPHRVKRSSRQR